MQRRGWQPDGDIGADGVALIVVDQELAVTDPDRVAPETARVGALGDAASQMQGIARTRTGRTLAGTVVTAVATLTATALLGVTPAGAAAATDGTPDTSFTAASGTGFDGSVNGLVVQSTAKIIAWGSFTQLNSAAVSGIARLTSAGAPRSEEHTSELQSH